MIRSKFKTSLAEIAAAARPTITTAIALSLAAGLCATFAYAQQQLPGLVVTVPPTTRPAPAPEAAPAAPAAVETHKVRPKPKPEAKTEKKRPAATASSADGADTNPSPAGGGSGARAAIKVNGEPITAYEIEQRARLLAMQANLGQRAQENMKRIASSEATNARWKQMVEDTIRNNPGKSRDDIMKILETKRTELGQSLQRQALESAKASVLPGLRDSARTELIEETIKLQEARRNTVKVDETEVEGVINNLAQNNKMSIPQLEKHFLGMGIDLSTLRTKFRSNLAWAEVIRRKYSFFVNPNQREIDKLVGGTQTSGEDDVELLLQRIVVTVPAKLDQRNMAQRFAEAETLRTGFQNCKALPSLANKLQGARHEVLGSRRPANFQEPTKSMLSNAKTGDMLPPNLVSQGIELLAVCERRVVKADEKRRQEAAAELRQKEFEILARRLLRDLQQNAIIENTK